MIIISLLNPKLQEAILTLRFPTTDWIRQSKRTSNTKLWRIYTNVSAGQPVEAIGSPAEASPIQNVSTGRGLPGLTSDGDFTSPMIDRHTNWHCNEFVDQNTASLLLTAGWACRGRHLPSAWLHLWAERRLYEVRQDRCHYNTPRQLWLMARIVWRRSVTKLN